MIFMHLQNLAQGLHSLHQKRIHARINKSRVKKKKSQNNFQQSEPDSKQAQQKGFNVKLSMKKLFLAVGGS